MIRSSLGLNLIRERSVLAHEQSKFCTQFGGDKMQNYVLYPIPLIAIKMLDKEGAVTETVFCPPLICMLDPENSKKILSFLPRAVEASRLMWHNTFGHWSNQSAILGQNDQNAPSQPWVDRKSKLVKIISKQYFSCFYIKPKPLRDFCQLCPSLTLG